MPKTFVLAAESCIDSCNQKRALLVNEILQI